MDDGVEVFFFIFQVKLHVSGYDSGVDMEDMEEDDEDVDLEVMPTMVDKREEELAAGFFEWLQR